MYLLVNHYFTRKKAQIPWQIPITGLRGHTHTFHTNIHRARAPGSDLSVNAAHFWAPPP